MRTSESSPASAVTRPDQEHVAGSWLDAWHVNPSLNKDYDAIDGLRGMAILMVVFSHLVYSNPNAGAAVHYVNGVISAGAWGVTIFFSLSGFLISHPFWRRKMQGSAQVVPRGYAGRRFWKIYPPLALSVILLAPLFALVSSDASSYLVPAGEWLIGLPWVWPVSGKLNPVMWSLIVEVHFYVLLPLLFLCFKRVSPKRTLVLIFLILLVVPAGVRLWNASRGIYFQFNPEINVRFPSMLDAFAFGVLLAGLENMRVIKRSWARLGDLGFGLLVVLVLIVALPGFRGAAEGSWQREAIRWSVLLVSALMLCYIADPQRPGTRFFSQPWLRWCGLVSYEWYLFHQPMIGFARYYLGPAEGNLLRYGAIVGGSFVVGVTIAALVYRYFSLPILKFGRKRNAASA